MQPLIAKNTDGYKEWAWKDMVLYSTDGLNGQGKQELAAVGPVDTSEHLGKRKTTILHNWSIIDV